MTKHEWREKTEEGTRTYRAHFHGGNWSMSSQLRDEESWTRHEPMTLPDLLLLRDVIWRKYQRRRLPWKQVIQIDGMIEAIAPGATADLEKPHGYAGEK